MIASCRPQRHRLLTILRSPALLSAALSTFLLGTLGSAWENLGNPLAESDLLGVYAATSVPWGHYVGGYPFGMRLWSHYQTLDVITETLKNWIYQVTGNEYLAVNLIWLISFPVCAALACWLMRRVGAPAPVAVVLGAAYTFIPYHWARGFVHPYLATMWSAVLGVILALLMGSGRADEIWAEATSDRRAARRKRVLLIVAAVVVAWSGIYYAFFTVVLMAIALAWLWAHGVTGRAVLRSAVPLAVVLVAVVAVLVVAAIGAAGDPSSTPISVSRASQSVTFSGAIAFMLVPSPASDLPGAGAVGHTFDPYVRTDIEGLGYGQFGSVVTTMAFAVFLVGTIVLVRRRHVLRSGTAPGPTGALGSLGLVAALLATALIMFVPWSTNFLFALWFSPAIRSWDRLLPIILLLGLVGAVLVSAELGWLRGPLSTWAVSACLLLVVLLDVVSPYPAAVRGGLAVGARLRTDGVRYAQRVNQAVPAKCAVLQLPYVPFPEKGIPIGTMQDYQHFLVALTNDDKFWSYGAVKHTQASDWAARMSDHITPADLLALYEGGFCGVHLDTSGYTRAGRDGVERRLEQVLGLPVVTAHDGQWQFYVISGSGPIHDVREPSELSPGTRKFFYPGE